MAPAAFIVVVPHSVFTLPATAVTAKKLSASDLPTNLICHPPAKGVAEVTLQATS